MKKKIFYTQDLLPTGKEFVKLSNERQKALLELLLSFSDTSDDVFRLEAHMRGGIYGGPFCKRQN